MTELEREKLRQAFEKWDKPMAPSRPAPKPEKKKRGKYGKNEDK